MTVNFEKHKDKIKKQIDRVGEKTQVYNVKKTKDIVKGEIEEEILVYNEMMASVQATNLDDLPEIPEGLREKVVKKIYFYLPVEKNQVIYRENGDKYIVSTPPKDFYVGGFIQYYKAFISKAEKQWVKT